MCVCVVVVVVVVVVVSSSYVVSCFHFVKFTM